jgi:hypothetical protein
MVIDRHIATRFYKPPPHFNIFQATPKSRMRDADFAASIRGTLAPSASAKWPEDAFHHLAMGAVPALSALRELQGALHNFYFWCLAKFISFRCSILEEQRAVSEAFLRRF